ncbi:phosphatidate cytidylyltransferase [Tannerella sp. CAG:118]|uniref:Phosphatidate cytidylyltransferase n=2 Tax=Coprobacter secundus TaxID=1501392 RepID=A0A7G1I1X6_9BACT|nr:phosphatidate cytidylyltransferase [Coprobacter secundus subsp. similis]CCY39368.1 phosphatidate cytidylyltransferase [Tannerella sp. CAG:118]
MSEFYRLIKSKNEPQMIPFLDIFGGVYLFAALYYHCSSLSTSVTKYIFIPYVAYIMLTFIIQLYAKRPDPIKCWAYSLLGQFYIALPFALLNFIAFPGTYTLYTPWLLMSFFIFIWTNDTGAFLVGITIGHHRLFERISPKKSWEGFVGGLIFSLIAAWVFSLFYDNFSLIQWLGLSLTISISSTFGDLCESLLKRTIHIKDSGHILPGHGGLLDRFDSVLLAAPAAYIYIQIFG